MSDNGEFNDSLGGFDVNLGDLDETFANTEAVINIDPPDGDYIVEVVKCQLKQVGESKIPAVNWQLRIIEPKEIVFDGQRAKMKGKMLFHTDYLRSKDNDPKKNQQKIGFFKGNMKTLEIADIQPGESAQMFVNRVVQEAIGIVCKVNKKTNGTFKNINFRKRLGSTVDGSYMVPTDDEGTPF